MSRDPVPSILDFIGGTPVVRLQRVVPPEGGRVHLKLEHLAPNGASQDRVAWALIEQAEKEGRLSPQSTVIEATTGNTGIGLAMVCALKGYTLIVVVPQHTTLESRQVISAYGARVEVSPFEEGMAGARRRAQGLADALPGAVFLNQFENPAALRAHLDSTAVELANTVHADGGRIDAFVAGVGSGALLTAVARVLKQRYPQVQVAAVEPSGEAHRVRGEPHRLMGIGLQGPLPLFDREMVDEVLGVSEVEAWNMRARLGREEGLLVGISTGANVVAANRLAVRLGTQAAIYTVAHDTGERYFSLAEQFA